MQHRDFNTIEQGKKKLAEIYLKYHEFSDIENSLQYDQTRNLTPDELSRLAVRVSILLCRIGELSAELNSEANEKYIYRKFAYLWSYNSLKADMKVKEKENIALDESFGSYEQELLNRFVADFIKTKYEDWSRVVMVIQSRLSTLKSERINSNLQT
jgi:hypothetical protein